MKVKEESEEVGLKLNIQKTKIMASGPITSWEIDGETVSDFIFLGSKITADGGWAVKLCGHKESDMTERLNWAELNWVTNTFYFLSIPTYQTIHKKMAQDNQIGVPVLKPKWLLTLK